MNKKKFSPRKYIIEKARKIPIYKCLIADKYDDMGLTLCLITRKQPSGKFTFAHFIVDRYCLGVKDAFLNCNFDQEQIDLIIEKMWGNGEVEESSPEYFHNLIYAAIDFAEENGFKPHKDFKMAEYVLDPELIDDGIDEIEVGGEDGKPHFISGPYDEVDKIIATLNRNIGKGNYIYMVAGEDDQDIFEHDL